MNLVDKDGRKTKLKKGMLLILCRQDGQAGINRWVLRVTDGKGNQFKMDMARSGLEQHINLPVFMNDRDWDDAISVFYSFALSLACCCGLDLDWSVPSSATSHAVKFC